MFFAKAIGQVNFKAIKKNHERFDCQILQTIFKDSAIFNRKNWGHSTGPFILNDFNYYFENCTIAQLYNQQVVLINKEITQRSDTLAILYISNIADIYTIDLFQPSSGSDCRIELIKTKNAYKVQKATVGVY
jgi:hypothetical protein